mgnify:CR=1 FL=1
MTMVELGQEAVIRIRPRLSLADAMREALGEDDDGYESLVPMRRVATPDVPAECGFRFQRCGGGRRVIKRQVGI